MWTPYEDSEVSELTYLFDLKNVADLSVLNSGCSGFIHYSLTYQLCLTYVPQVSECAQCKHTLDTCQYNSHVAYSFHNLCLICIQVFNKF